MEKQKKRLVKNHPFWHTLAMIIVSEVNNLIWFVTAIVIAFAGWVIFKFSVAMFFKLVVGLPLGLIGVSLALMKIYEIVLTIVDSRRLKGICTYCPKNNP